MTQSLTPDDAPSSAPGLTGPLKCSIIPVPGAGKMVLTHCPGRHHVDASNRHWRRSLAQDLEEICRWDASGVVSLLEPHEFLQLGVPDFAQQVQARGIRWFHLAIPDMHPPGNAFHDAWRVDGGEILALLKRGESIVLHCAAGLGRSGMLAAKILTAFGMTPTQAIEWVRARRPGAIETAEQAQYVHKGASLVMEKGSG